jgi:hypothetical protein
MISQFFSLRPFFKRSSLSLIILLCVSCGGGGSGSNETAGNLNTIPVVSKSSISGYVVKGPTAGATVRLFNVDVSGRLHLLATANTSNIGFFSFTVSPSINSVVLLEATGGSYIDEISAKTTPLTTPLRLVGSWDGTPMQMSPTVYSEVAVRILERTEKSDWSALSVSNANNKVEKYIGATSLLDFKPIDLMQTLSTETPRENDVGLSFFLGGFSGFMRRLDTNPLTMLNSGIDGIYKLVAIDEHDDRLMPALINGMVEFIELTKLSDAQKKTLKTFFLLANSELPLLNGNIENLIPSGTSSGSATANMPNDVFQVVGNHSAGSVFNARGALIAFPLDDGKGKWNLLYSASVAELYGDGDVGIGRWNGGAIGKANRFGSDFDQISNVGLIQYRSLHYAVAKPATQLPICGIQKLQLLASTQPTLAAEYIGASLIANKLTADSSIALQYLGETYIGVDIGVIAPDGSITRYTTPGGIVSPWASGVTLNTVAEVGIHVSPSTTGTILANYGLNLKGLLGGIGGKKFAAKLVVGSNSNDLAVMAAVFNASNTEIISSSCTAKGSIGNPVTPAPVNGPFFVFSGVSDQNTYYGASVQTNFRTRGEISSTENLQIASSAYVYSLMGNADAMIGLVDGNFSFGSSNYNRAMPYGLARPGANIPVSGSRHYTLVSASPAVAEVYGVSNGVLPQGQVTSATLDINFGDYPIGTPNPYFGTALLNVAGILEGVPFNVYKQGSSTAVPIETKLIRDGARMINPGPFEGALAAPNGEYAVVRYFARATGPNSQIIGTLLFRAQ